MKQRGTKINNYEIIYELEDKDHTYRWDGTILTYNGKERKSVTENTLPDNILVYYSGHNDTVSTIINEYQERFSKRLKDADIGESRKFLGIGSEYKSILLGVLLLQPETSKAKTYVCKKLGIPQQEVNISLTFKRPVFAKKDFSVDRFDEDTFFWGTKGITLDFLNKIISCIKDSFSLADLYNAEEDNYHIKIDGDLYRTVFENTPVTEQFRFFDNLNTLEMLKEISAEFDMENSSKVTTNQFSDGQFQSIYIYSILEFYKDRNCLLLLDEPDSFLHPEWQFEFLKQVFEIAETDSANNHILMSSHSAVTLVPLIDKKIKFFDIKENSVNIYSISKQVAISKLSSDLIRYSEFEPLLSVLIRMKNERKAVFLTEGISDPIIIKQAWHHLYSGDMPFILCPTIGCNYLYMLLNDDKFINELNGFPIFGLFDFDKAYNQWNGINGSIIENDPNKGLIKKRQGKDVYAMMVPLPIHQSIRNQVVKCENPIETYCDTSHCEIEHLFYGSKYTANYFKEESCPGGGKQIDFISDSRKIEFVEEVIPKVEKKYFEVFLPLFEFIKSKC